MTGYQCKQALAQGKTLCGTLIVSPLPKWTKYIGQCNLDFVFIDTEHVALDIATLSEMCMLYSANKLAPIVRISSHDSCEASRVLDAGAHGILAPYIENAEQVRQLVGAVHYKPLKGVILQEVLHGERMLSTTVSEQLATNNENHVLLVNIESCEAMRNLDEILDVPGLDGIVIGPNDLSYSLGIPNDYDNPVFEEAVVEILKRARAKGVAAGIHYMGSVERQIEWAKKTGMNLLFHSGDMYIFVDSLRNDLTNFRTSLGEMNPNNAPIDIVI